MSAPWHVDELSDGELARLANGPCRCVTPEYGGTEHGFTCIAHRASNERKRRREANQQVHVHIEQRQEPSFGAGLAAGYEEGRRRR